MLSRSSLYYEPRAVPAADLAIMRRIDALHLDYPFAGSRMLRDLLHGEGVAIGRERVATMVRRMGIEALYRRLNVQLGHQRSAPCLACVAARGGIHATDVRLDPVQRGDARQRLGRDRGGGCPGQVVDP